MNGKRAKRLRREATRMANGEEFPLIAVHHGNGKGVTAMYPKETVKAHYRILKRIYGGDNDKGTTSARQRVNQDD